MLKLKTVSIILLLTISENGYSKDIWTEHYATIKDSDPCRSLEDHRKTSDGISVKSSIDALMQLANNTTEKCVVYTGHLDNASFNSITMQKLFTKFGYDNRTSRSDLLSQIESEMTEQYSEKNKFISEAIKDVNIWCDILQIDKLRFKIYVPIQYDSTKPLNVSVLNEYGTCWLNSTMHILKNLNLESIVQSSIDHTNNQNFMRAISNYLKAMDISTQEKQEALYEAKRTIGEKLSKGTKIISGPIKINTITRAGMPIKVNYDSNISGDLQDKCNIIIDTGNPKEKGLTYDVLQNDKDLRESNSLGGSWNTLFERIFGGIPLGKITSNKFLQNVCIHSDVADRNYYAGTDLFGSGRAFNYAADISKSNNKSTFAGELNNAMNKLVALKMPNILIINSEKFKTSDIPQDLSIKGKNYKLNSLEVLTSDHAYPILKNGEEWIKHDNHIVNKIDLRNEQQKQIKNIICFYKIS